MAKPKAQAELEEKIENLTRALEEWRAAASIWRKEYIALKDDLVTAQARVVADRNQDGEPL